MRLRCVLAICAAFCILLSASWLPSTAPALVAQPALPAQGIVNSNANLRSGPGTAFGKVGSVKAGDAVQVVKCNTDCSWYQLENNQWIAAFLVDLKSGAAPAPKPAATPTKAAQQTSKPAAIFGNPAKVCTAMTADGLGPMGSPIWTDQDLGYFACYSDDLAVTEGSFSAVGDVPNDLTYGAESDVKDRVQTILLSLDVFNTAKAGQAVKSFGATATTMFKRLGLEMPAGLAAAVAAEKPGTFTMPYGEVKLTKEAFNLGYGLKIEIADIIYLQEKNKKVESATPVFEQCRQIIAALRKYPVAEVKGDGEPIDDEGATSFLLEGRGGDIFFCKIKPDNTYLIDAAIGGNFPFEVIGSGKLAQ